MSAAARAQRTPTTTYTVADYLTWPSTPRCELIDGVIYNMSPAPIIEHQRLSHVLALELGLQLRTRRRGDTDRCGRCQLFSAPIDVVLAPNTVVQPDLIVVCDPAKLANGKNVQGAPDLVVEILSPATAIRDRREKRRLYERHGIPDYLVIDPHERYIEHYRLQANGQYGAAEILGSQDQLDLPLFPDLTATLGEWFGWPLEDLEVSRELEADELAQQP